MTDNDNANTIGDLFRTFGAVLNNAVYFLLGLMYQIFFNVSSAQLFESETIKNFYGRVQLIIGVFMVFKLAVSILQGIMDPDKFLNPKEGFGNLITRVVIALALLTVLVPINVPDVENANSFEKYLNNNGLLFGTLYSLQDRILSNNTLGRLILGTTDNATYSGSDVDDGMTEAEKQRAKLQQSSRIFSSTILKGFLRINLLPAEVRSNDDETKKENWYCGANLDSEQVDIMKAYQQLDIDPSSLLSGEVITSDCEINQNILDSFGNFLSDLPVVGGLFNIFMGKSRYLFAFNWIMAFIIGVVFLVILVGFTIDIAIRSIKLAILRLLAPIPVISYIDPKSSKDGGMFSSWVKALTSTYLDLFLRLAIVYFVIFLIQDMIVNGIVIDEAGGMVGIISFIFIMLGLFFFAQTAPKFIKDVLGLKGIGMSNIGLSGILGGAGAIRQGGTMLDAWDAASDAANAQVQAYNQGKAGPGLGMSFNSGRDYAAKMLTGNDKATYKGMNRGRRRLAAEGITPWEASAVHDAAIAADSFSERMEADARAGRFSYMDDQGRMQNYRWEERTATGGTIVHDVTNAAEMSLALSQQKTRSGILKAQDSKVDAEVKNNMQSRSYRDKKRRPNTEDPGLFDVRDQFSQRSSNRYNARYNNGRVYNPGAAGGPTNATGADINTHL